MGALKWAAAPQIWAHFPCHFTWLFPSGSTPELGASHVLLHSAVLLADCIYPPPLCCSIQ